MGRKIGHEFLGIHGVALRTIPTCWTRRNWKSGSHRSKGNASRSTRASVIRSSSWSQRPGELRNNTAFIDAMTEDWNRFLSVVQTDKEGNRLNIIKVDGVDSADEKVIGKRLQEIAKNATTGGLVHAGR